MTGGQPVDGVLSVPQLTRQLAAEGVGTMVIVSDEPDLVRAFDGLAPGVTVRHRDENEQVQRELREVKGVSALIFAQTCASEKRRRRKRQLYPDPDERVYINTEVCEGCGDCSRQSNCLSVEPVETALGLKRRINQSSCNKDYSCVRGFCPSFVTVHARDIATAAGAEATRSADSVPAGWPAAGPTPALDKPVRIVLAGVGGTGVITVGALLGMAAHLEDKAVCVMDMGGMAQKGGTVYSYVQLAGDDSQISATKIAGEHCDLLLGADTVVAGHSGTLSRLRPDAMAILNEDGTPTADFVRSRDWTVPVAALMKRIGARVPAGRIVGLPAARLAERLLGDALYANMMILGYAWQSGRLPLARESLQRAIELNGVAVDRNIEAFRIGCHLAADDSLAARLSQEEPASGIPVDVDAIVTDRSRRLRAFWNAAYAGRYERLVRGMDASLAEELRRTVATQLYRVMAYKDEYEVARLLTSAEFRRGIDRTFGAGVKVSYNLAPPALSGNGPPAKRRYGPWMQVPLALLARLRGLRETPLDVFGRSEERRRERAWRERYIRFVESLAHPGVAPDHERLLAIARLPADVRGFGHIKLAAMDEASARWDELERAAESRATQPSAAASV
jgi:indolepyruvate ferredoxin oxidoreductase